MDIFKAIEDNLIAEKCYYYFLSGVYLWGITKYIKIISFLTTTPFPQRRTSIKLHAGRIEHTPLTSEDSERYINLYFESIDHRDYKDIWLYHDFWSWNQMLAISLEKYSEANLMP